MFQNLLHLLEFGNVDESCTELPGQALLHIVHSHHGDGQVCKNDIPGEISSRCKSFDGRAPLTVPQEQLPFPSILTKSNSIIGWTRVFWYMLQLLLIVLYNKMSSTLHPHITSQLPDHANVSLHLEIVNWLYRAVSVYLSGFSLCNISSVRSNARLPDCVRLVGPRWKMVLFG